MLVLIHRTMKNIVQNIHIRYNAHHKHHQIVFFIIFCNYWIKLFLIISSISIDDCFHLVFVISDSITFRLEFHIIIVISFLIFFIHSHFIKHCFISIWCISAIHQTLSLSFDIYSFIIFYNDCSSEWISHSNVAHHFASFSKCFIISNIECFDEYQYSEYDSQSQYCSNKCFFHFYLKKEYKKSDYFLFIRIRSYFLSFILFQNRW